MNQDWRGVILGEFMLIGFIYLLRKGRIGLLGAAISGKIELNQNA